MISVHDYLAQHGTGHEFEMTEEMQMEAESLCEKVNAMQAEKRDPSAEEWSALNKHIDALQAELHS